MYMEIATVVSKYSYSRKIQVGSIIVRDDRILSIGINGTPVGWPTNECEDIGPDGELYSKDEVLHSEANAITKLAKSTESGEGAVMFITHSPCLQCAKLIVQTGIVHVYYQHEFWNLEGLHFLEKCNVPVTKISC